MRPDGELPPHDRPPRTGRRLDLFFYELVETPSGGERYYLRLTGLAVLLILGLTVAAMAGIIVIFLTGQSQGTPARIELTVPESTPLNLNEQVIKPMPPPPPLPRPARTRSAPPPAALDPATDPAVINSAPTPESRNSNAPRGRGTPGRPGRE